MLQQILACHVYRRIPQHHMRFREKWHWINSLVSHSICSHLLAFNGPHAIDRNFHLKNILCLYTDAWKWRAPFEYVKYAFTPNSHYTGARTVNSPLGKKQYFRSQILMGISSIFIISVFVAPASLRMISFIHSAIKFNRKRNILFRAFWYRHVLAMWVWVCLQGHTPIHGW